METVAIFTNHQTDIAQMLAQAGANNTNLTVLLTDTIDECYRLCVERDITLLILQLVPPVYCLQNLIWDLQERNCYPAILLFEPTGATSLRFSISDPDAFPGMIAMKDWFCCALASRWTCTLTYFHSSVIGESEFLSKKRRSEALAELLRGTMEREYQNLKKSYKFDFRENGYYIMFWNLFNIEYAGHRYYKDVLNFIGTALQQECQEIIDSYNGGEVFYIDLQQLCVILNDLKVNSKSKEKLMREQMFGRLGKAMGCKTAIRYLSRPLAGHDEFRTAYDGYVRDCSLMFFVRDQRFMRGQDVLENRVQVSLDDVQALSHEITQYLKYDISNPKLMEQLRHLYLDVLKRAMDYSLYNFSTALIYAELLRLSASFQKTIPGMSFNTNTLQFSSIEEQYSSIRTLVLELQLASAKQCNSKHILLLRAMEMIAEQYNQDISPSSIASALYISNVYLSQIFRNELHTGVANYLIQYRIEKSKQYLSDTDLPVWFVAEQVGFRDSRHFSKTFKRIVGQTPRDFRRNTWSLNQPNSKRNH